MIGVYWSHNVVDRNPAQIDLDLALSAALIADLNESIVSASCMGNSPVVRVVPKKSQ